MVRKIVWGDEVKPVRHQTKIGKDRRKMWLCTAVGGFPSVRTLVKLRAIQASGISNTKQLKQWWLSLEVSNRS